MKGNRLIKEIIKTRLWIGVLILLLANIGFYVIALIIGREIINIIYDIDRITDGKKIVLGGYYLNMLGIFAVVQLVMNGILSIISNPPELRKLIRISGVLFFICLIITVVLFIILVP